LAGRDREEIVNTNNISRSLLRIVRAGTIVYLSVGSILTTGQADESASETTRERGAYNVWEVHRSTGVATLGNRQSEQFKTDSRDHDGKLTSKITVRRQPMGKSLTKSS